MRINGRVVGWDAASSERHPSVLRYRSAARKGEHPVESLAPPRRWIFRINNLIRRISQTASQSSSMLSFLLSFCFSLAHLLRLLTFHFILFLLPHRCIKPNHLIKPISSKQKLDVKKTQFRKIWKYLVPFLIKHFFYSSYIYSKYRKIQMIRLKQLLTFVCNLGLFWDTSKILFFNFILIFKFQFLLNEGFNIWVKKLFGYIMEIEK